MDLKEDTRMENTRVYAEFKQRKYIRNSMKLFLKSNRNGADLL